MRLYESNGQMLVHIENIPAVYAIFGKAGELLYIGCTATLRNRLNYHRLFNRFGGVEETVEFIRCDCEFERYAMERWLIAKHRPSLNKYKGWKAS